MAGRLSPSSATRVLSIDVQPEPSQYRNPDNFLSRLTEAGMSAGTPGTDCVLSSDIVTFGRPLAGGGECSMCAPALMTWGH